VTRRGVYLVRRVLQARPSGYLSHGSPSPKDRIDSRTHSSQSSIHQSVEQDRYFDQRNDEGGEYEPDGADEQAATAA